MPIPVVLDCDPGHDDAIALLMAARHCELLAVTTVSGNVDLARTTRNALLTTQLLELQVPVHAGAERPLLVEPEHAEHIHGDTGLDGPALPELQREVASREAVRCIVETARARDGVWLVATGPLTNVALALRQAPDLRERLAGISIMGGSRTFGNHTAAAEFNIWHDPEAAAVVFGSGVRLLMAGLDLTHQFLVGEEDSARLRRLGNRAGAFAADLFDFFTTTYEAQFLGRREGPLHDPCAVLALSHPELFERQAFHVAVECRGTHTRGMTVVDHRRGPRALAPNCEVLTRIDADAARDLLVETVASYR